MNPGPLGPAFAFVRRDRLPELDGPDVMPGQGRAGRVLAGQVFGYGIRDPALVLGAALAQQLWDRGRIAVRRLFGPRPRLRVSTAAFVTESEPQQLVVTQHKLISPPC